VFVHDTRVCFSESNDPSLNLLMPIAPVMVRTSPARRLQSTSPAASTLAASTRRGNGDRM
jgi:hypothetical protein